MCVCACVCLPPGAEARRAVVPEEPQRPRLQPGTGDDPPAHLPPPAALHPVRGGVWVDRVAHALAAHPAHQSAAAQLPAVQRHAIQVGQSGRGQLWVEGEGLNVAFLFYYYLLMRLVECVCVIDSWFRQPHLARVRLVRLWGWVRRHTCGA